MSWDWVGLGLKSQAEGETGSLSDRRNEFDSWDLGDRFRSAITGVSKEDVLRESARIVSEKINDAAPNVQARSDIDSLAGGFNLGLGDGKIRENETEAEYQGRLRKDQNTAAAASKYSLEDNADVTQFRPNMTAGDIVAMQGKLISDNKDDAKAEVVTENRRIEERQDRRENRQTEKERLDRNHQTLMSNNRDDLQIRLGQMNQQLENDRMDFDRETRRMDKRDKAIATLMSGLGSLGGAFTL